MSCKTHPTQMAAFVPNCPQMAPAKMPASCSVALILRAPCFILHPFPSNTSALASPSIVPTKAEPVSRNCKLYPVPVRASPVLEFAYPSPIPEFAEAETRKFRNELLRELSMHKDTFGDDLQAVVEVCSEILYCFLHDDYGGPGTLLVEPFTDMFVAIKERKLAGASTAARTSLLWAQNNVDQDWVVWISEPEKKFYP